MGDEEEEEEADEWEGIPWSDFKERRSLSELNDTNLAALLNKYTLQRILMAKPNKSYRPPNKAVLGNIREVDRSDDGTTIDAIVDQIVFRWDPLHDERLGSSSRSSQKSCTFHATQVLDYASTSRSPTFTKY